MRRLIRTIVLANLLLPLWQLVEMPSVFAQGTPIWTNRYNGPANADDQPNAIILDGAGNVFVTGGSSSGNTLDYATIKYSNSGVPLWTNRYNGPGNGNDEAFAMALHTNGNLFVTGRSEGTNNITDYGTLAYSPTGVPLWTNRYNGFANQSDLATDVAVDRNGNVYVTGSSFGIGTHFDYATLKYSSTGVPQWTNGYNGSAILSIDFANALAVDTNGNVFIAGTTTGAGASFSDFLTVAYSTTGTRIWTNGFDGDTALAVEVDSGGNVIVAGLTSNNGTTDPCVVKYSNAGARMWTNVLRGPPAGGSAALAVDRNGNVFVSGFATNNTGFDRQTAKYSPGGTPLWTNRFKGPEDFFSVQGNAIAIDVIGNVFATGSATNGSGNYDFVTVAYSHNGIALWTNRYNGSGDGDDVADAIAVDAEGNVYVTGRSTGTGGNFDYLTIKYSPSLRPLLSLERTAGSCIVRFNGVPEASYRLQRATNLAGPWTTGSPQVAPASGQMEFTDSAPPAPPVYYRVRMD